VADALIRKEEFGRVSLFINEEDGTAKLVPGGAVSRVAVQAGLSWYLRFTVSDYDMALFVGSRKECVPRYRILEDGSVEFDLLRATAE